MVLKQLEHRDKIFKCPVNRVIWCYGIYKPKLNAELRVKGYLLNSNITDVSDREPYDIAVLDDSIQRVRSHKMYWQSLQELLITSHVFIMQNLFPPGKDARTRSTNTHY